MKPPLYSFVDRGGVLFEYLGHEAVAGGPVVDVGQELLGAAHGCVEVLYAAYYECMEVVFLDVMVREQVEIFGAALCRQCLCVFP